MITYLNPPIHRFNLGESNKTISLNTLKKMKEIILLSSINPYVRKWAEKIVEKVEDRDKLGEVQAIWDFMHTCIRYVNDPLNIEYIQTPPYIFKQLEIGDIPNLDCDDFTVLSLSLLRSLGFETTIRMVSYNSQKEFEHVYGLVFIPSEQGWIVFDGIKKDKELGWEMLGATNTIDMEI